MAVTKLVLDRQATAQTFSFGTTSASGGGLVTINNGTAAASTLNLDVKGSAQVGGDLAVLGNLNITGSINEASVTNLLVTDKTITLNNGAASDASAVDSGVLAQGASAVNLSGLVYTGSGSGWAIGSGTFSAGAFATKKEIMDLSSTQTASNKTLTSPTISGGTINNASVGATTASTGAFTTLSASGTTTLTGNLTQTGATTFGTGTGAVSLNGTTTVASGKSLALAGGFVTQTYTATAGAATYKNSVHVTLPDPGAGDPTQTAIGLDVSFTGADSSTAGYNYFTGVNMANFTPHTSNVATGIAIGTGWDYALTVGGTSIDGTGNLTLGTGKSFSMIGAGTFGTGSGTVSLNGNTTLSAGKTLSMSAQFTNTLATGTAPFAITSTTKVANLNVDQVDGCDVETTLTNSSTKVPASSAVVTYVTGLTGSTPFGKIAITTRTDGTGTAASLLLASTLVSGTEQVFVNGLLLQVTNDYTISYTGGTGGKTLVTFVAGFVLASTDNVQVYGSVV